MKKILLTSIILTAMTILWAQSQSEVSKAENQNQFNLEEFEIIHLSSGVIGETNVKIEPETQQVKQGPSREERQKLIQRLQEIRTGMRKIEDDTAQKNPELKAIVDKINELQQKKKELLAEIMADNFEYQQLKQKIASGDFQASDTMRLAMLERQASQDQRIKEIDQQITELYAQRQALLQKVLQDNQEYQAQIAESQSIMQNFRAGFQRPDTIIPPSFQAPATSSSTGQPSRWNRDTESDTNIRGGQDSFRRGRQGRGN